MIFKVILVGCSAKESAVLYFLNRNIVLEKFGELQPARMILFLTLSRSNIMKTH